MKIAEKLNSVKPMLKEQPILNFIPMKFKELLCKIH